MNDLDPHLASLAKRFRTYTIKQVAALIDRTPQWLWRCIRAARDDRFRKKYLMSASGLERLPLRDWYLQGGEWVIAEEDLLRQLDEIRRGYRRPDQQTQSPSRR